VAHDGTPCPIRPTGGDVEAALAEAESAARELLMATGADVMLWGRVTRGGRVITLRFIEARRREDYLLDDNGLMLPAGFAEELGALIAAKAVTLVDVPSEARGSYLVPAMEQAVAVLEPLVARPPKGLTALTSGVILEAYARAKAWIGVQRGSNNALREAAAYYRKAAENFSGLENRWHWAKTQNNLGTALAALGEREAGTARLEEAVAAYRVALEEWKRERVPLAWATVQVNLGNALVTLGAREAGTERLEEALAAYRAALEERTRARAPLDWAITQNNLGTALTALEERGAGTARLEEALVAWRWRSGRGSACRSTGR
jgi:tetratricopeptide (TPR) repeat protein